MAKKIVVCCDGTGNEFEKHNTNVVQIFEMVKKEPDFQVAYYDPGVGTFGNRYLGFIAGYGITQNITDAYEYLMNRYEDGDQVFLFGFSRGAFTVRALAGMLRKCGLLHKGSNNLIEYATNIYRGKNNAELAAKFKETFARPCPVYFIGVWDTVKALFPFSKIARFHDNYLNQEVSFAYHALAIDERRKQYAPELWQEDKPISGQVIEQVWFAGVHSDVGGSYAEKGLADVALKWMIEKAEACGLEFDKCKVAEIHPDPLALLHNSRGSFWKFLPPKTRTIPPGAKIHSSVFERVKNKNSNYNPENLP